MMDLYGEEVVERNENMIKLHGNQLFLCSFRDPQRDEIFCSVRTFLADPRWASSPSSSTERAPRGARCWKCSDTSMALLAPLPT